jgi:hypothetical protein
MRYLALMHLRNMSEVEFIQCLQLLLLLLCMSSKEYRTYIVTSS